MIRPISKNFKVFVSYLNTTKRWVSTSIDQEEIARFSSLANNWWDPNGDFRALHTMNKLRVPFIRDRLDKLTGAPLHQPLKGLRLLDVGCGGGLLSEPLSRLGADVTGLDASHENIETAKYHALQDSSLPSDRLKYLMSSVEDFVEADEQKNAQQYDGVVLSEIVEHVSDVEGFLKSSCSLVKPGGSLFITTLNKTWLSYLFGIVAAERILKMVPVGVHDWEKFISPQDVKAILEKNNFEVQLINGMFLNPINFQWSWCENQNINYALHAVNYSISE